jgi:hypothetical protein
MLSPTEKELCASLSGPQLFDDTKTIASFNRLSGSHGEAGALDFIENQLQATGVPFQRYYFPAILSTPQEAHFSYVDAQGEKRNVPCKTWSFTPSTAPQGITAPLRLMAPQALEHHPLTFWAERNPSENKKDLEGIIVVSRTSNPVAIMDAERRGAIAFVILWSQGDEELIHEGNVNMVWGTPEPEQTGMYTSIPVIVLSKPVSDTLASTLQKETLQGTIYTNVLQAVTNIPVLEAVISSDTESPYYLLVGSHLDSWHYGASDNATGNAIALALAETFAKLRGKKFGLRICWWSGHSNGRYAGSSAFASRNFISLNRHCLAYSNIDMPGMRGASNFSRITVGSDLMNWGASVIEDLTGQKGVWGAHVRGWDQSFQNIGISPYLIWSSTLPKGSPYTTSNSFMSWWWHTEKDLPQYTDSSILKQDGQIYLLALSRILCASSFSYNIRALIETITARLDQPLFKAFKKQDEAKSITQELQRIQKTLRDPLSLEKQLSYIRNLNRILYAFKAPELQDWAINLDYIPGLSLALSSSPQTSRGHIIVRHFMENQLNRIILLLQQLQ